MAQKSRFFDSISGDRVYTSADLAEVLARLVARDGVLYGYGGQLAVQPTSPESLAVRVQTGAAWVQGRYVEVYSSPETLAIATPDGVNDRIDRVVVRLNLTSTVRSVSLAVKEGTPAASPSPPALQRDATIWELSLARIRVRAGTTSVLASDITDERADATVCGYTAFATLEPTGSGLVAQDSAYTSGVSGFTPTSVRAALDALAGVRLVESGSNANGRYWRWENGLQIATSWVFATGNGVDYWAAANFTWPAAFTQLAAIAAIPTGTKPGADPVGPFDVDGWTTGTFVTYGTVSGTALIFANVFGAISSGVRVVAIILGIGQWK